MGMTIDEEDRYTNACIKYLQKNMECVGFRDYIIELLNKYQKIQEIVNSKTTRLSYEEGFRRIKKVVEDGTD